MDIINSLKIGQNISVQINDNGINLKNGGYVADENGNRFKILSVAMINNHKRLIDSNAELLLAGDVNNIGKNYIRYDLMKNSLSEEQKNALKYVANSEKRGIINTGGISGALNPYSKRAEGHAVRYYESVRHMTTDVARIASNTGYSTNERQRIKNFIFMEKHDLGRGKLEDFDASYEMAQSWQRLIDGKNIQQHDLILLKHEIMENKLVDLGIPQSEAHIMTSKEYNYSREARKYYDTIEKHKKR